MFAIYTPTDNNLFKKNAYSFLNLKARGWFGVGFFNADSELEVGLDFG